jgi:hypothetical protein
VRQRGSQDTDNKPYECTAVGVLDVNDGMSRHVESIRLGFILQACLAGSRTGCLGERTEKRWGGEKKTTRT